ncbi:MAG: hypothetical protein AAF074_11985 [Pseudomonadota bacterium]
MPLGPAAWQRTADRIAGGLSWRNAGIDTAIYDIPGLTAAERRMIRQTPAPEGAIVVAHPLGAEGPVSLAVRADFEALAAAPGAPITQVAIAGHGGSALGAAALARTVADATGRPAGGIVAGFTGEDLFAEAMGGQVFFKALGSAQNAAQLFRHRLGQMALQAMRPGDRASRLPAHALTRPAAATLIRLLGDPERRLDLAVAHGKGALGLSFALARLADRAALARAEHMQIVTAGCVTAFPEGIRWATQFLGQFDALGTFNSETAVAHESVPGASHHLNTAMPLHMDLGRLLRRLLGT